MYNIFEIFKIVNLLNGLSHLAEKNVTTYNNKFVWPSVNGLVTQAANIDYHFLWTIFINYFTIIRINDDILLQIKLHLICKTKKCLASCHVTLISFLTNNSLVLS